MSKRQAGSTWTDAAREEEESCRVVDDSSAPDSADLAAKRRDIQDAKVARAAIAAVMQPPGPLENRRLELERKDYPPAPLARARVATRPWTRAMSGAAAAALSSSAIAIARRSNASAAAASSLSSAIAIARRPNASAAAAATKVCRRWKRGVTVRTGAPSRPTKRVAPHHAEGETSTAHASSHRSQGASSTGQAAKRVAHLSDERAAAAASSTGQAAKRVAPLSDERAAAASLLAARFARISIASAAPRVAQRPTSGAEASASSTAAPHAQQLSLANAVGAISAAVSRATQRSVASAEAAFSTVASFLKLRTIASAASSAAASSSSSAAAAQRAAPRATLGATASRGVLVSTPRAHDPRRRTDVPLEWSVSPVAPQPAVDASGEWASPEPREDDGGGAAQAGPIAQVRAFNTAAKHCFPAVHVQPCVTRMWRNWRMTLWDRTLPDDRMRFLTDMRASLLSRLHMLSVVSIADIRADSARAWMRELDRKCGVLYAMMFAAEFRGDYPTDVGIDHPLDVMTAMWMSTMIHIATIVRVRARGNAPVTIETLVKTPLLHDCMNLTIGYAVDYPPYFRESLQLADPMVLQTRITGRVLGIAKELDYRLRIETSEVQHLTDLMRAVDCWSM